MAREPVAHAGGDRLLVLEGLRGILALVVFVHHFTQAFIPALQNADLRNIGPAWLAGTPLQVLFNGPAAVVVFYVMTGFVLTYRAFLVDGLSLKLAGLKRWPRLAGPTTCAVLLSYVLFATGLYAHEAAGAASQSRVLSSFFDHLTYSAPGTEFKPHLGDAILEGALTTYTGGSHVYDPVLWMIQFEFKGALVALVFAAVLLRWRSALTPSVAFVAFAVLFPQWSLPFLIGVLLAMAYARNVVLGRASAVVALGGAVFFLGATAGHGVYAWVDRDRLTTVWAVGGALLLAVALRGAPGESTYYPRWARHLGAWSFPLYLVHQPVIASAGSWAYLAALNAGASSGIAVMAAGAGTVLGCVPLVYALARFDERWVRGVNRIAAKLTSRDGEGNPVRALARAA